MDPFVLALKELTPDWANKPVFIVYIMDYLHFVSGPRPKEVKDYNKITFGKLKSRLPLTKGGIRDQTTGKRMTVEEAVESGILQFNPLHIMNNNGDKYCMHEAAVLGLVEPHTAREIFRALEPNSLGR